MCLSDNMIENIVIAQGGTEALPNIEVEGKELTQTGSPFDRQRSHLRGLSDLLLEWVARQAENQNCVVYPKGPGRHARLPLNATCYSR